MPGATSTKTRAAKYDPAEHRTAVLEFLDRWLATQAQPRWFQVADVLVEVRAHLKIALKRSECVALLALRVDKAPRFSGRLRPREAAALRTILRHGEQARVRFYRSSGGAAMKCWIAGRGFERGGVLSNAAAMSLRKRGILIRESGDTGGDSGLFRLAKRVAEPGMFWVR